jgi:hypothetical protein
MDTEMANVARHGHEAPSSYDEGMRTVKAAKPRTRLLLPVLLAAIVLGILGMHALARHGAMPGHGADHHPGAATATSGTAEVSHHDGPGAPVAEPASEPAPGMAPVSLGAGLSMATVASPHFPLGEMTMLCAAMLLAAAAGALLSLRLRRVASADGFSVARPRSATARLLTARAGTGPPYVWEFSVVRC